MSKSRKTAYYNIALDLNGGIGMKLKRVFICGGDMRSVYMAEYFKKKNIDVRLYGHSPKDKFDGLNNAEVAILGLPAVKDGMVYMPGCQRKMTFYEFLKECPPKISVCGGRFTLKEYSEAEALDIKLFDYSEDEVFQIENALYTAEGAVARVIESTPCSLHYCRILIVGYGRIGKTLAKLMSGRMQNVAVYARKERARAECKVNGIEAVSELSCCDKYDVIINTVPYTLFDDNLLSSTKKDVLIVDLSASPGYVDKELCRKNDRKLLYLPGVPLWSAPQSAGISAAEAVERFTEGNE